jgi:hypothetical protein
LAAALDIGATVHPHQLRFEPDSHGLILGDGKNK